MPPIESSGTIPSPLSQVFDAASNDAYKIATEGGAALGRMQGFPTIDASVLEQLGSVAKRSSRDGLANDNGAPIIPQAKGMSISQMMLELTALNSKIQQAQGENATNGLKVEQTKLDKAATDTTKKLQDWIKGCEDAAAKDKQKKTASWISKIFGAIAAVVAIVVAVVATVATGGASAPLLALAVMGAVASLCSLVDTIEDITNTVRAGMDPPKEPLTFGPSSLAAKDASEKAYNNAIKDGKSEEEAQMIKDKKFSEVKLAMGLTFAVLAMVGSVAGAAGAAKAGMEATMQTVKLVTGTVTALANLTKAAADITGGVLELGRADDQYAADSARVDSKRIEATVAEILAHMQAMQDALRKILADMEEGVKACSDIVGSEHNNYQQVSQNLGTGTA